MPEETKSDVIDTPKTDKPSCIPPIEFKRNEFGLLCNDSVKYVYNNDGTINWRAMVNPKYLVPNKQAFERYNKQVPRSIDGLDDSELLILLGGIKELAQIRGYTSVNHFVTSPSSDFVVSSCQITWIPNYETENRSIIFSAIGDASPINTNSFTKNYLGPMAENRAFVRCVRNFLKINIVSKEEIGGNNIKEEEDLKMSTSVLIQVMTKYGVSFDLIKSKLIEEKYVDSSGKKAEDYTNVNEIPNEKQFEIINRIQKKAAEKSK